MSTVWLSLLGIFLLLLIISLSAAWILMFMDNEEEKDNGVHRGTDQEVHGSAAGSSSGGQPTGTSITTTTTENIPISATYTGYPQYGGALQGTSQINYQHALAQLQAAQNSYFITSAPSQVFWTSSQNHTVWATEPEARKPIPNEGIRVGEIIAYRCWPINNGFLWSTAAGRAWAPGEPMKAEPHHLKEGLGVYSFKERSKCIEEFGGEWVSYPEGVAFGTIQVWGEIVEHETGYRSEYAAVLSIDYIRGGMLPHPRALEELQTLYKVKS